MTTTLETTADPNPSDLAFLGDRLSAFNDSDVGASGKKALAVFVRDESNTVVGGVSGYTAWGWLYVQWLWVDERLRGQHIAGRMLEAAEAEAAARGCHGALIDTFSPVAARAYERQGYRPFGVLPDFPVGRSRIFLQKQLSAA
ncbi:MAG: GNAT family N-acetyltransferase [Devosia sp.]